MAEQRKGISSRPDKQVEGGSILSSGEVEVIEAEYTDKWVYPGTTTTATGLLITFRDQTGEEIGGNFWSCGDVKNVEVSEDGNYIYALSGQEGFPKGCNLALLYDSMEDAGYPLDKHPEDGHVRNLLIGLRSTIIRVEQKKRDGLVSTSKSGRPLTTLNFVKVVPGGLPWEKKKSTAAKTTAKGKTNAAPSQEDVDEKTAALLLTIVGEEGTVNRKVIGMKAYQHATMKGDPHRNVYSGRISKPEFLETQIAWAFDSESGDISAQA